MTTRVKGRFEVQGFKNKFTRINDHNMSRMDSVDIVADEVKRLLKQKEITLIIVRRIGVDE